MIRKRIVIVGGVADGASDATCARKLAEEAEIILIERGPHLNDPPLIINSQLNTLSEFLGPPL